MDSTDVTGFLNRIGVAEVEPPSLAALSRLHSGFAERVPYGTLDIQLGRPTSLDPIESAHRIVRHRRGGYCFHLNGVFAALLRALGYQVTMHHAGVQTASTDPEINKNHLALSVCGLPDAPQSTWLVDLGLGDGIYEPIPLQGGTYHQEPFTYRIRPSDVATNGWRLEHDPAGSFIGMDFDVTPARLADFAGMHDHLSTSPESSFVKTCVIIRRGGARIDTLRAKTLSQRTRHTSSMTILNSQSDWFAALNDIFGIPMTDLSRVEREQLWRRVSMQHETHHVEKSFTSEENVRSRRTTPHRTTPYCSDASANSSDPC
ncbi:arylamine N-acetyltransferase family protein [Pseudonocardia spinosispora]|uniref:arylamine N-acetyltransferase family protein n=1 Tax=Pseudonocardia spinosispora TaxID=103441 RepID=UPI000A014554|nr:arylamine N-acetyltransferase [Pseudonocardia spinosispora]